MNSILLCRCAPFFVLSSVEGNLACFQFLGILKKAEMNIVEQISLWLIGATSEYITRRDIAW